MLRVVGLAVGGSYSKSSNNCVGLQLAVLEHLFQVVVDGRDLDVVELRHHLLAQPLAATKVRYSAAEERTREAAGFYLRVMAGVPRDGRRRMLRQRRSVRRAAPGLYRSMHTARACCPVRDRLGAS